MEILTYSKQSVINTITSFLDTMSVKATNFQRKSVIAETKK